MPTAKSLDLRIRVVAVAEEEEHAKNEIADLFGISKRSVYRYLQQLRERNNLEPLAHGGGTQAKLKPEYLLMVKEMVDQTPDATLEEFREQIKKRARLEVSVMTISRGLKKLGITRKKSPNARPKPTRSPARNLQKSKNP